MILSAIAEKLKRRAKDDFKGRHYEATLILQAVSWYLRYPLSYRDNFARVTKIILIVLFLASIGSGVAFLTIGLHLHF